MPEQATSLALLALNRMSDPTVAAEFFEIPGIVNVDQRLLVKIFDEREANGEFRSIDDVRSRVLNVGELLSGRMVQAAERFVADPGAATLAFEAVAAGRLPVAAAGAPDGLPAGAGILPFVDGLGPAAGNGAGAADPAASGAAPRNAMDALLDAITWTAQGALAQALLGGGPAELKPVVSRLREVALEVARGNPFSVNPEPEVEQRLRQVARRFRADQIRGERQPLAAALVAAIGEVAVRGQVPGEWTEALTRNGIFAAGTAAGLPPLLLAGGDGNGAPGGPTQGPPPAGGVPVAGATAWEFQMNIQLTECVRETLPEVGSDEFVVVGSGTYEGKPVKAGPFVRVFDAPRINREPGLLVRVPLVVSKAKTSLRMTITPFEEDVLTVETAGELLEVLELLVAVLGGFLLRQTLELLKLLRESLPPETKLAADVVQILFGGALAGLFADLVRRGTTFALLDALGHDPFVEYRLDASFFWPDARRPPEWMAQISADGFPPGLAPQRLVTGPRRGEGRINLRALRLRELRRTDAGQALAEGDYALVHQLFLIQTR